MINSLNLRLKEGALGKESEFERVSKKVLMEVSRCFPWNNDG